MIRVIAQLLVKDGMLVKGQRFDPWRVIGEPVQWVRVMAGLREVDEIVMLDVGRGPADLSLIERVASECFVPLAYGGGIYSVEDAEKVVALGVDKIVLLPKHHKLMAHLSQRVGRQAVVVCVDHYAGNGSGGPRTRAKAAQFYVKSGAGEVLVQAVQREGMMTGPDLELAKIMREALPETPLIYSGGMGTAEHFVDVARTGVDAIAAGAVWSFTDLRPDDVKVVLAMAGHPVRLTRIKEKAA